MIASCMHTDHSTGPSPGFTTKQRRTCRSRGGGAHEGARKHLCEIKQSWTLYYACLKVLESAGFRMCGSGSYMHTLTFRTQLALLNRMERDMTGFLSYSVEMICLGIMQRVLPSQSRFRPEVHQTATFGTPLPVPVHETMQLTAPCMDCCL